MYKINFNPTTRRTSRTSSRWSSTKKRSSYTKFHKRQNYQKSRYTLVHIWENWKKLNIKSQEPKNIVFGKLLWNAQKYCFFRSCDLNFFLLQFTKKCVFWLFWLYCLLCNFMNLRVLNNVNALVFFGGQSQRGTLLFNIYLYINIVAKRNNLFLEAPYMYYVYTYIFD